MRSPQLDDRNDTPRQRRLPLFDEIADGTFTDWPGGIPPLTATSPLPVARYWFRDHLQRNRRPANTIEAYGYDLVILENISGLKPICEIDRADIANYLGAASSRSTRKRRLTTARVFFAFLTVAEPVLTFNPTEGFFPHPIPLKMPVQLFADDVSRLLTSAGEDEPWSLPAVWLMLRLGLTRGELLGLRVGSIDLSAPESPVVHIVYDEPSQSGKSRRLLADAEFGVLLQGYFEQSHPVDLLFPVGFQAVNAMVQRMTKRAGIDKPVTPQTLRHAFAIDQARRGITREELLALLGLLDEPRNRQSIERYFEAAPPPFMPLSTSESIDNS